MKFDRIKRVITGCILSVMIVNMGAFASFTADFTWQKQIASGSKYTKVLGKGDNKSQTMNYIEYIPNGDITPIIAYGDKLYGKSTITEVAEYVESSEGFSKQVIAGINGDYFSSTGVPVGLVINEGVLTSSDAWQYAVGFSADGRAIIGKPTMGMSVSDSTRFVTVDYFNKVRTDKGIYLLDSNFSSQTRISTMGTNVILEKLDHVPIMIGGNIRLRVVDIQKTDKSQHILPNQVVLTVSDVGPVSRFPSFGVGDEVSLQIKAPDANWQNVMYAVGGKELLLENGAVKNNSSSVQPRSAVGIKTNGTVVLMEIDGRKAGISEGMTLNQVADYMKSIGCVWALNLDGGGSSAMVIQKPGNSSLNVINDPSEGSLRQCANYIFLVNNMSESGYINNIHIYPQTRFMLEGSSVKFDVKATDENYFEASPPSNIKFSVLDGGGSVTSDGVYTAGQTGTSRISAQYGDIYTDETVHVISYVDKIRIYQDGKSVNSLSVQTNKTVDLSAKVLYKGNNVASNDNNLIWQTAGDIGTIDKDGVFTAASAPKNGKIMVSHGNTKTEINVNVGLGMETDVVVIDGFDDGINFTSGEETQISVENNLDNVLYGKSSLKVSIDFQDNDVSVLLYKKMPVGSLFKNFGMWIKTDTDDLAMSIGVSDKSGQNYDIDLVAGAEKNGFKYYSCALPEVDISFNLLNIKKGVNQRSSIFIDQMIVSASDKLDLNAPTIKFADKSIILENGQSKKVLFTVTDGDGGSYILKDNLTVLLDGKPTAYDYDTKYGKLAVDVSAKEAPIGGMGSSSAGAAALPDGLHRITVIAKDKTGNISRGSVDITVGKVSNAGFSDINGHWANAYIGFVSQVGLMKGESRDDISYFNPNKNLTRAEFAVTMARYLNLDTSIDIKMDLADIDKIPSWALGSIKAVYKQGIMTGILDTATSKLYFNPSKSITRSEVMTVISKTLPRGYEMKKLDFKDSNKIPSWAKTHVETLTSIGIIGGYEDGTIRPEDFIIRAEIAKILTVLM